MLKILASLPNLFIGSKSPHSGSGYSSTIFCPCFIPLPLLLHVGYAPATLDGCSLAVRASGALSRPLLLSQPTICCLLRLSLCVRLPPWSASHIRALFFVFQVCLCHCTFRLFSDGQSSPQDCKVLDVSVSSMATARHPASISCQHLPCLCPAAQGKLKVRGTDLMAPEHSWQPISDGSWLYNYPEFSLGLWGLVAHIGSLDWLTSLPCLAFAVPCTSQINCHLELTSYLRICFWGCPNHDSTFALFVYFPQHLV